MEFTVFATVTGSGGTANSRPRDELHLEVVEYVEKLSPAQIGPLSVLIPHGCGANVSPIVEAFTQLTGVRITIEETPVDDINTQLVLNALSGNTGYDIALPATFGLPDLVAAGVIIPLTQFAQKYEPDNFRSSILFGVGDTFDDDIYGFQTDGDAYVMFYNRRHIENPNEKARFEDRFGRALAVPETWEELDQQMEFFHRPDNDMFGGLLFRIPGYLAWEWWVRFHAKGIWPLARDLTPQINSDQGVEALEELIRATDFLAPEVHSLGLFGNWERFSRGDIYCNIGWGGSQKYLNGPKSGLKGDMVYGPTPGGMLNNELLRTAYFNWGWNYVVTADSAYPELAYLFSLFAASPTMSTISVRQQDGYFDPIQEGHHEDPKIREIYSREFLSVHEKSLRSAIPDLYLANQGAYFQSLSAALDRALAGKISSKKALDQAADEWRVISKRSGVAEQTDRWNELRNKYPIELQSRLQDLN
jgi:multiple sugar transport system substrate-binding protein